MWASSASGVWPLIASQVYLWVRLSIGRVPQLCQSWFLLWQGSMSLRRCQSYIDSSPQNRFLSTSSNSHAIADESRSYSKATWCEPPAMSLGALRALLLLLAPGRRFVCHRTDTGSTSRLSARGFPRPPACAMTAQVMVLAAGAPSRPNNLHS